MYRFYIGGSKISGAEGRILSTAALIGEKSCKPVEVVLKESLYNSYRKHLKKRGECIKKIPVSFMPIKDQIWGWKNKAVYCFFLIVHNLFAINKNQISYFVLFNPLFFPSAWWSKKVFFEVTSPDIAKSSMLQGLVRWFRGIFIVCVSKNVERVFLKHVEKFNAERIYVRKVPYSKINPSSDLIHEKKNLVVFAHRLIDRKNPLLAARAFIALSKKYPNWEFQLYGTGPLEQAIANLVSAEGLANLNFMGYTSDLLSILESSQIFVSLIEPDNYPSQSLIEAAALGNALVVSDVGDSKAKFIDGNGFAVPLDLESLVKAISKLIESKEIKEYQVSSVNLVRERYDVSLYVEEQMHILNL